jgi:CBS-domain-containing membrane protein
MKNYFKKMKGDGTSPPRTPLANVFWSFIGAFLGISSLHYTQYVQLAAPDINMVIGSFGASAVLIYGAIDSPLAQPRNLIGGHIISALFGVFCYLR